MVAGQRPIRVLMVDDEIQFLNATAKVLKKRGFLVLKTSSSEFVNEILETISVDVAVLDIRMPGINGFHLYKEFRRRQPDVPVIMLTGFGTPNKANEMYQEGVFAYLGKPCEIDVLVSLLRSAYDYRKQLADV